MLLVSAVLHNIVTCLQTLLQKEQECVETAIAREYAGSADAQIEMTLHPDHGNEKVFELREQEDSVGLEAAATVDGAFERAEHGQYGGFADLKRGEVFCTDRHQTINP